MNHAPSECTGCTSEHASMITLHALICTGSQHHVWQTLNKSAVFRFQGQRRKAFRRPASQAEEPEHLDPRQQWIQRPREHGGELQSAAVRCQAYWSADVHLHGGGWRKHCRVPGQHSGLQWVRAALWRTNRQFVTTPLLHFFYIIFCRDAHRTEDFW